MPVEKQKPKTEETFRKIEPLPESKLMQEKTRVIGFGEKKEAKKIFSAYSEIKLKELFNKVKETVSELARGERFGTAKPAAGKESFNDLLGKMMGAEGSREKEKMADMLAEIYSNRPDVQMERKLEAPKNTEYEWKE
ncbi:MAG: hypothetical protein ABIH99_01920 [Candidatus Micrarchaeota archaeon]